VELESGPLVSRHDGYETAFMETSSVELRVE
jgi:hypothetical protein